MAAEFLAKFDFLKVIIILVNDRLVQLFSYYYAIIKCVYPAAFNGSTARVNKSEFVPYIQTWPPSLD